MTARPYRRLGMFMILFERWRGYMSAFQFLGVMWLVFEKSAHGWWILGGLFVVSIAFEWFIDRVYIYPGYLSYMTELNTEFNNRLDELKKLLEERK